MNITIFGNINIFRTAGKITSGPKDYTGLRYNTLHATLLHLSWKLHMGIDIGDKSFCSDSLLTLSSQTISKVSPFQ